MGTPMYLCSSDTVAAPHGSMAVDFMYPVCVEYTFYIFNGVSIKQKKLSDLFGLLRNVTGAPECVKKC